MTSLNIIKMGISTFVKRVPNIVLYILAAFLTLGFIFIIINLPEPPVWLPLISVPSVVIGIGGAVYTLLDGNK